LVDLLTVSPWLSFLSTKIKEHLLGDYDSEDDGDDDYDSDDRYYGYIIKVIVVFMITMMDFLVLLYILPFFLRLHMHTNISKQIQSKARTPITLAIISVGNDCLASVKLLSE
jgi:hypothetical protein